MKTKQYYNIRYTYVGFDNKFHTAVSTVKGRNEKDAVKTLGAIINRKEMQINVEADLTEVFKVARIALA